MFRNKNGQVRSGWILIFAGLVYLIGQSIFMFPGLVVWTVVENDDILSNSANEALVQMDKFPWISLLANGGSVLGGIIITLILWKMIYKEPLRVLGFQRMGKDFVYGLFLGAASITLIFLILLASGQITLANSLSHPNFTVYTVTYLLLYILVGFSEEMFFRGFVMSTLISRGNRKWVVFLVSALIFSLAHGSNPNVSWLGLVNIFLVGLLFAYMYDTTKSLWLPIGFHMTWNYFQGNIFGFPVSGTVPHGIYTVSVEDGTTLLTGGTFGLEGGLMATILIIIGFFATKVYTDKKYQSLF
ncbi:type II CAAX endopeptidase family protein [Virgibacillus sp. 179-BFC.A HS]|uniref:Type II CAAX endopeptidase family protein n=1 Tax=Tigheibacillus jepli TaxID=3035914 RepID=A0ABU5CJL8_9BACI|nr:type II CAAX endopeptidase family protein [Virgibacillus sp. 179-BFC.A HS]MDY0406562.1 type II CAAX endopeptidase family protein [Virgibacillus sp. 179-BFC.A HS]